MSSYLSAACAALLCSAASFSLIMTTPTDVKPAAAPAKEQRYTDLRRLVRCLEELEGGQWHHPGGKLCFTHGTWQTHSKLPYIQACNPTVAREVAATVLIHHEGRLLREEKVPTVRTMALCWRHGYEGMLHHKPNPKDDYAERAENLYNDKEFNP